MGQRLKVKEAETSQVPEEEAPSPSILLSLPTSTDVV